MTAPRLSELTDDPDETFVASNGETVNRRRWQLGNIGGSAIKHEFRLSDSGPRGCGYEVEECEVAEVVLDAVLPLVEAQAERRGAVKALRGLGHWRADERADEIEAGADW